MLYPHQAEISNFCYSYSFFLNVNVKQPGNCSQQSNRECYRAIKVHSLIPIVQHTTLPYHTIFSITILFDIIQFELSAFISWSTTNRMYITEHTFAYGEREQRTVECFVHFRTTVKVEVEVSWCVTYGKHTEYVQAVHTLCVLYSTVNIYVPYVVDLTTRRGGRTHTHISCVRISQSHKRTSLAAVGFQWLDLLLR